MEIVTGLIVLAISALVAWIYNQSIKITKLETNQGNQEIRIQELQSESSSIKASMYGIDTRLDRRVAETTTELTKFLHELQITLKELNITVSYMKDELKELKKK